MGFEGCQSADLSIKVDYGVDQRAIKESYFGGKYICQDLGYASRETVGADINIDGVSDFNGRSKCVSFAKTRAKEIMRSQNRAYVEREQYAKDEYSKTETAGISISYNPPEGYE